MKLIKANRVLLATVTILSMQTAHAEGGAGLFYLGVGAAKTASANVNGSTPMSIGLMNRSSGSNAIWGVDMSVEGTVLDSTWGQTSVPAQGFSFNFLFGRSLPQDGNSRFDIAVLAGMRQTTTECPGSNLGYQCYANTTPNTSYGFNYGAILTWSYESLLIGVRATGVSTQALFGLNF